MERHVLVELFWPRREYLILYESHVIAQSVINNRYVIDLYEGETTGVVVAVGGKKQIQTYTLYYNSITG